MQLIAFDKQKYTHPLQMDFLDMEKDEIPFMNEVHATDFFEVMLFMEDANGFVQIDEHKIEIKKGTFLFISPYQKRRWFIREKHMNGYALIFEKDFLGNFFADELFVYRLQYFYNHSIPPYLRTNKKLFSYQHDILEEIQTEITNYQLDSEHLLRSILYYMLIKMNREFLISHNLKSEYTKSNHAYLFKEALEKNFKKLQYVNDYVSLLNVSRITLNQSTKKQFGITASELIKDRILSEIKSKLLHSTQNISEIAFELNFSEPNNLIRFFRNKTGFTPLQFRFTYQIDS